MATIPSTGRRSWAGLCPATRILLLKRSVFHAWENGIDVTDKSSLFFLFQRSDYFKWTSFRQRCTRLFHCLTRTDILPPSVVDSRCLSRIPDLDFSIPDPDPQHWIDKEFKYFNPKSWTWTFFHPASRIKDPWIRDAVIFDPWIRGQKSLDPWSRSATLSLPSSLISWHKYTGQILVIWESYSDDYTSTWSLLPAREWSSWTNMCIRLM